MKEAGIRKAIQRHQYAAEACHKLAASNSFEAFAKAWEELLIAGGQIYSILEQSAMPKGSRDWQWYAQKRQERLQDPLLEYLKEARNVVEHGLEEVVTYVPGDIKLIAGRAHIQQLVIPRYGDGLWVGSAEPGGGLRAEQGPPETKLRPVYSKYHDKELPPPATHLGKDIQHMIVVDIAIAYLYYLDCLIGEAARL